MNDLIDRDHRDDDIRALLDEARTAAPDPVPWNDVVERHDRRWTGPRRGPWTVAAAVIVVGLLGLVLALQLRGDPGDVPADRPDQTEPSEAPATDPLADLGPDDWVVPTELPDGYDVVIALEPDRGTSRSLTIGGSEVFDIYVSVSEVDAGTAELSATEPVELGGSTWLSETLVAEDGPGAAFRVLERRAGDRIVRLTSNGAIDDLEAIASHLRPVDADEFDGSVLSSDGVFTEVLQYSGTSVSASDVDGYYCVRVESPAGGGVGCGASANGLAPIGSAIELGDGDRSFAAGVARGDVARIEFRRPSGPSLTAELTDPSGPYGDRFWIADGLVTGDQAIVTYDDDSTQLVERTLPGRQWAIVGDADGADQVDLLADLGPGDRVEPIELPDGYDTAIAIERTPSERTSDRTGLILSGPDVNDIDVNVRFGGGDPVDGETVELGGAMWTTNELVDEETGEVVGRRAERRAGEAIITITSAGDSQSLYAVADALRPVDPADATIPFLSADGPFTSVFTSDDLSVEVRGEAGYYCLSLVTPDGTTSIGCGTTTSARAPLADALGQDGPSGALSAGVAEGDVARIEFLVPGRDPVVVEPADESGEFGERFWIAEGVNFFDMETVHRAIITYDDSSTALVERSPLGSGWLPVDEP